MFVEVGHNFSCVKVGSAWLTSEWSSRLTTRGKSLWNLRKQGRKGSSRLYYLFSDGLLSSEEKRKNYILFLLTFPSVISLILIFFFVSVYTFYLSRLDFISFESAYKILDERKFPLLVISFWFVLFFYNYWRWRQFILHLESPTWTGRLPLYSSRQESLIVTFIHINSSYVGSSGVLTDYYFDMRIVLFLCKNR